MISGTCVRASQYPNGQIVEREGNDSHFQCHERWTILNARQARHGEATPAQALKSFELIRRLRNAPAKSGKQRNESRLYDKIHEEVVPAFARNTSTATRTRLPRMEKIVVEHGRDVPPWKRAPLMTPPRDLAADHGTQGLPISKSRH
jgi:hypothetical protein